MLNDLLNRAKERSESGSAEGVATVFGAFTTVCSRETLLGLQYRVLIH